MNNLTVPTVLGLPPDERHELNVLWTAYHRVCGDLIDAEEELFNWLRSHGCDDDAASLHALGDFYVRQFARLSVRLFGGELSLFMKSVRHDDVRT